MPSEILVSLHRPPINLLLSAPVIPMTLNVFRMKWPTDIPILLQKPDFHPFSWQILVLPALALPIRNLCLPMEPSVPTTSPALLPPTRWLCWPDCLWPQSLVKNSFFIFGLSSSANICYKLTSTLYTGFLSFLTFFYKVDKFKAFSLFFRGHEISLLCLQGRGGNVIHWFQFEMQSTFHLPYIIPSKLHPTIYPPSSTSFPVSSL